MLNQVNLTIRNLYELLEKTKTHLPDGDVDFVTKHYMKLCNVLTREQIENNDIQTSNITFVDRIRFIHYLIVDGVQIFS